MVAERVPLWEVTTEWQRMGPAAGEIGALLSRQLADAFEFLRTHLLGLGLTVCLFFFILIVAAAVEPEGGAVDTRSPAFRSSDALLKRPVSLSLLITLVLSLVFFTDNAPRLVRGLGALLLLIPVLRLLPRLIHPAARPVLFTVSVFYIFDSVLSLFLAVPLVDRLAFLVLDIVAFIVLIWLLRLARVRQLSTENATPAYLIFLFQVSLFLVCVSPCCEYPGLFRPRQIVEYGDSLQRLRNVHHFRHDQSTVHNIRGTSRHGPGPVPFQLSDVTAGSYRTGVFVFFTLPRLCFPLERSSDFLR